MSRGILLLCLSVLLLLCQMTEAQTRDSVTVSTAELADRLIAEAEKYIGVPYRLGGKGPKSFDCSGYTRYVYGKFGIDISANSTAQAAQGREVKGSVSNLQKGDILLFGMRNNRKRIGHVGLYIGSDASGDVFSFIHASRSGVRVSKSNEDYWASRFLGARRLLPDFLPGTGDGSAEDFDSTYVAFKDTLVLSADEYRVVLLEDGTWAYVLEDGTVRRPSGLKEKIVLDTNGRWISLPISMHTIPSQSAPAVSSTASAPVSSSSSSATTPQTEGEIYHIVKSGDTLYGLARRYGTNVNAICRLNGITSGTVLKLGRKLRVK